MLPSQAGHDMHFLSLFMKCRSHILLQLQIMHGLIALYGCHIYKVTQIF